MGGIRADSAQVVGGVGSRESGLDGGPQGHAWYCVYSMLLG